MIFAIGRYAALLGFIFAVLLHLAGYVYVDLPSQAYGILMVGIFALAPLALRGPFLDSHTPIDTLPKKIAGCVAGSGLVLWLLATTIWILCEARISGLALTRSASTRCCPYGELAGDTTGLLGAARNGAIFGGIWRRQWRQAAQPPAPAIPWARTR